MRHRSETPIQYQRDLLDTWLSAGNTRHRQIRAFTTWLARSHVTGPLTVSYAPRATMAPLADDDRCALLERLLHDDAIQPGDRLAGTLVVLYGQPFTRIAALHASDIHTDAETTTIALGRGTVPLPEPLDALAETLRRQRVEAAGPDAWLFQGGRAGSHLCADRLRERLKALGITSRPARQAALLALAARLPAPISPNASASTPPAPRNGPASPARPTPTTQPCATAPDPAADAGAATALHGALRAPLRTAADKHAHQHAITRSAA